MINQVSDKAAEAEHVIHAGRGRIGHGKKRQDFVRVLLSRSFVRIDKFVNFQEGDNER